MNNEPSGGEAAFSPLHSCYQLAVQYIYVCVCVWACERLAFIITQPSRQINLTVISYESMGSYNGTSTEESKQIYKKSNAN